MRSTGILLAAAVLWLSGCRGPGGSAVPSHPPDRPNILFIMTDQQRFDGLGANGNALLKTPNLDRLASESANFQYAFVQAPVCVPSRITWFTGRYPHAHRNRVNYTPLKKDEILLPKILRDAGYRTGVVGKLHLTPGTAEEARRNGFDEVLLHDGVSPRNDLSDYFAWQQENDPSGRKNYRALARNVPPGENPYRAVIDAKYTDTAWTGLKSREMLARLAEGEAPFFLFASWWKPHSPFEVPVPYDSMYDDVEFPLPPAMTAEDIGLLPPPLRKLILRSGARYEIDRTRLQWIYRSYYAAISHIDVEVGLLLEALEKTGRADNTIVIFSTDHGDQLWSHGVVGKNVFFEESVRIPFLFKFPGRVKPGKYGELIETTDLVPTLCELTGVPEPKHVQGRSFAPLVTGRRYQPREAVFSENIIPEVITGHRLNFPFEKGKGIAGIRHPDAKMVRTRKWKLNYYPEGYGELYDLEKDPGETKNLYGGPKTQDVVADLKGRLLDWLINSSETEQIAERWLK